VGVASSGELDPGHSAAKAMTGTAERSTVAAPW
jgi:hypothetical protein